MLQIKFSQNWNRKLFCDVFTTIRLRDDVKYVIGRDYHILLTIKKDCDILLGIGTLLTAAYFTLDKMTENMALIDTGYKKAEVIAIMKKMYQKPLAANPNVEFGFYTIWMPQHRRTVDSLNPIMQSYFNYWAKEKDEKDPQFTIWKGSDLMNKTA